MRTWRSSGSAARQRGRPRVDRELPLAPRGPRRRQPALRRRVRRDFAPPVAAGRFEEPLFGPAVEVLVTDKSSYREGDVHWRRRGPPRRPARSRPRRCRRRHARRRRAALRGGHRRRALRGSASLRGTSDAPRGGPRLLWPAAGRRPHDVPAPSCQPLRRRGARQRPRLTVRRRVERRARPPAPGSRKTAALQRARALRGSSGRATSASSKRSSSATTGSSASARVSGSRRSATASSPSTTTTWRCSRAGTVAGGTPTCESSGAWRGRTRSCAAPTSKASSGSLPTRRRWARKSSKPWRSKKARTRCDCSRSTRPRGSSSRSRRRRCRPQPGARRARRNPVPAGWAGGLQGRRPSTGRRHAALGFEELREAERVAEEAETRRLYYVAMTRAVDRLIISGAVDPTSQRDARAPSLASRPARSRRRGPAHRPSEGARARRRPRARAPTVAPSSKRARPCRPPTSCRSSCRPTAARLAWPPSCRRSPDPGAAGNARPAALV